MPLHFDELLESVHDDELSVLPVPGSQYSIVQYSTVLPVPRHVARVQPALLHRVLGGAPVAVVTNHHLETLELVSVTT